MRIRLVEILRDYDEQIKLLIGYRKLLEEQIDVINAPFNIAKQIKTRSLAS